MRKNYTSLAEPLWLSVVWSQEAVSHSLATHHLHGARIPGMPFITAAMWLWHSRPHRVEVTHW